MKRRVGIRVSAAGLALCFLLWTASFANIAWQRPRVLVFGLWSGMLELSNGGLYAGPGWSLYPGFTGSPPRWWPHNGKIWEYYPGTDQWPGANWALRLPLWMPAGAFAGALVAFCRPWDRRAERRRLGLCERCAYDARGLGQCPECGGCIGPDAGCAGEAG